MNSIGDTVRVKSLCWKNEAGGTDHDHRGVLDVPVQITKAWGDYEIGERYWADLLEDVDVVRSVWNDERTLTAGTRVYVGQFDVIE